MSIQEFTLILHLILAALYLPLLFTLIRRQEGHETTTMFLSGYVLVGLLLQVGEGLWRGGRLYIASRQVATDFQTYGALVLAFLLTLTVVSFVRLNEFLFAVEKAIKISPDPLPPIPPTFPIPSETLWAIRFN